VGFHTGTADRRAQYGNLLRRIGTVGQRAFRSGGKSCDLRDRLEMARVIQSLHSSAPRGFRATVDVLGHRHHLHLRSRAFLRPASQAAACSPSGSHRRRGARGGYATLARAWTPVHPHNRVCRKCTSG